MITSMAMTTQTPTCILTPTLGQLHLLKWTFRGNTYLQSPKFPPLHQCIPFTPLQRLIRTVLHTTQYTMTAIANVMNLNPLRLVHLPKLGPIVRFTRPINLIVDLSQYNPKYVTSACSHLLSTCSLNQHQLQAQCLHHLCVPPSSQSQ